MAKAEKDEETLEMLDEDIDSLQESTNALENGIPLSLLLWSLQKLMMTSTLS